MQHKIIEIIKLKKKVAILRRIFKIQSRDKILNLFFIIYKRNPLRLYKAYKNYKQKLLY